MSCKISVCLPRYVCIYQCMYVFAYTNKVTQQMKTNNITDSATWLNVCFICDKYNHWLQRISLAANIANRINTF